MFENEVFELERDIEMKQITTKYIREEINRTLLMVYYRGQNFRSFFETLSHLLRVLYCGHSLKIMCFASFLKIFFLKK